MKKVNFTNTPIPPKVSYNQFSNTLMKNGMRVLDKNPPNPYADTLELSDITHIRIMTNKSPPDSNHTYKKVDKYTLHVDDHGIRWKADPHGRSRTLRVFTDATESAYWEMGAEQKIRFLRDYIDSIDQWIIRVEVRVSDSWVERQQIRDEFACKAKKWYDYLQSYRLSFQSVADKRLYNRYCQTYDTLTYEFEVQMSILENATEMSYWKAVREFWRELKKSFAGLE